MQGIGKIYVHIDGPRANNKRDLNFVTECRTLTKSILGSKCSATLFQVNNLGGKVGMQHALDWFFKHESFGLIVEDDVVIHPSAPLILEKALLGTIDRKRIGSISLHNPLPRNSQHPSILSAKESLYPMIWGWATWAETWWLYKKEIDESRIRIAFLVLRQRHMNLVAKKYWIVKFIQSKSNETWDTQLLYTHWKNNLKTLTFDINLATNIGFDERATRTKKHRDIQEITGDEIKLEKLKINNLPEDGKRDRALASTVWGLSYGNGIKNLQRRLMSIIN